MSENNKANAIAFLNFCCRLAVYPTRQGLWVLQAAQKKGEIELPVMTTDELYDAFENNKLDELLKDGVESCLMDIKDKFPPYDHKYLET